MTNVYSVPLSEPRFDDYSVTVNGIAVPVLGCSVSAIPYNRRWPGHQRATDQTEPAFFVRFAAEKDATVSVTVKKDFKRLEIRPLDLGVKYQRNGNTVTFTLPCHGGFTVEPDGWHNALHLFYDAPKTYPGPHTYTFGPGVHRPGTIVLHTDESLYIDEGAIVYGRVEAHYADRCRIVGKGILDNSEEKETILFEMDRLGDGSVDVHNSTRTHAIDIDHSNDCLIEGITIRDSLCYNLSAHDCNGMTVDNIKAIGDWRYNSDGVDLHNCCHCVVKNCFLRTFDDTICVKGHPGFQDICRDIVVDRCVCWNDWDHTLEIGAECCAKDMCDITFRNCYIIHAVQTALSIANVDYGHIHDVLYDNISVEYDEEQLEPKIQESDDAPFPRNAEYRPCLIGDFITHHHEYSVGDDRGRISGIRYRNIRVYGMRPPRISLRGFDADHRVSDVEIDGLFWNGRRLDSLDVFTPVSNDFACEILMK